jgi:alkylhydroperoxidase family enzyme
MSDVLVPRIPPLLPPDWDQAAFDAMNVLPHGRDNILASWRAGKPAAGTNFVCTQLRHPTLAKAFLTFNAHFFYSSKLSARMREILILRIACLRRSDYEFAAHVELGRQAGLTDEDIERIRRGPSAAGLAPEDANLVQAVDDLKQHAQISDATWAGLVAQRLDPQQLIELIFIVGCYEMLAMAMNSCRVQFDGKESIQAT